MLRVGKVYKPTLVDVKQNVDFWNLYYHIGLVNFNLDPDPDLGLEFGVQMAKIALAHGFSITAGRAYITAGGGACGL